MVNPEVSRYPAGTSGQIPHESGSGDLVRGLDVFFRGLTLSVLVIVMICGVYYAIEVFGRIGGILSDPKQVETAVGDVARMVESDKMKIEYEPNKTFEPGRALALVLLGIGYLVWSWIPIQIVAVTGRVLLSMTKKPPEPRSGLPDSR